ncbi:MAG: DUF4091 domain-containing protein, partial [Candidatus Geothermincolia bacterium]
MHAKRVLILAIIILMLAAPAAAGAAGEVRAAAIMRVWVVSDGDKILRDAAPRAASAVWSEASGRISLRAAGNEFVAFQAMITAEGGALGGVNASLGALSGPGGALIPAAGVELFREHYLNVTEPSTSMYGEQSTTGPGWYPDALIPFSAPDGGAPFSVSAGLNQGVWADIYVPGNTPAGVYHGTLTVSATAQATRYIPVDVSVWGFNLPAETHLDTWFMYQPDEIANAHGVYKYDTDYLAIEAGYAQMAREHRLNAFTSIYPEYSGSGTGLVVNWDSYHDELAARFLDGLVFEDGRGIERYCLPMQYFEPDPDSYGGRGSAEYEATFITMLQQYKQHFVERGWFDRTFMWVLDEPNSAEAYDLQRYYGELIDRSGTGFPLMATEGPTPQEPEWGSLVGYVDIWNVGGTAWPDDMHARQAAGEEAWTYNGGEPYCGSQIIDTGGLAMRTWPWVARRYGVQGWLYWDVCYFKDIYNGYEGNDVWTEPLTFDQRRSGSEWPDYGNGDGTLFYPGAARGVAGPISSIRMKEWRRGAQDYEYLWLLDARGQGSDADAFTRRIIPYAFGEAEGLTSSWSEDPAVWEQVRLEMGELLEGGSPYSRRYYLAEGYTGDGFQEYICLGNPSAAAAHVHLAYSFSDSGFHDQYLTLPAYSRTTVDVNRELGAGREVSCTVESDSDIAVERPMYFNYLGAWTGGHDVAAA